MFDEAGGLAGWQMQRFSRMASISDQMEECSPVQGFTGPGLALFGHAAAAAYRGR